MVRGDHVPKATLEVASGGLAYKAGGLFEDKKEFVLVDAFERIGPLLLNALWRSELDQLAAPEDLLTVGRPAVQTQGAQGELGPPSRPISVAEASAEIIYQVQAGRPGRRRAARAALGALEAHGPIIIDNRVRSR